MKNVLLKFGVVVWLLCPFVSVAQNISDGEATPSLNDIRFKDWDEARWLDNEYIETLRQYVDGVANGKITGEDLAGYKDIFKSKFIIANIEPSLLGGTFIQIIFLDAPNDMFSAWVYSTLDDNYEKVTGYEVRSLSLEADDLPFTKAELLQTVKEHPELKLW